MTTPTRRTRRGDPPLSRERIIDAAIALLDADGADGFTFRALAERLATGAGAIYWHVAGKDELLGAACDAIVAAALEAGGTREAAPRDAIQAIGMSLFDAIDAHPWVGAELARVPGAMPLVRILEGIGRQVRAIGVPEAALWLVTSTLLHCILGVAGQNAANGQAARARGSVRAAALGAVADAWAGLDADAYPFTRSVAHQMRSHDDRADFAAGLDLILAGVAASFAP